MEDSSRPTSESPLLLVAALPSHPEELDSLLEELDSNRPTSASLEEEDLPTSRPTSPSVEPLRLSLLLPDRLLPLPRLPPFLDALP